MLPAYLSTVAFIVVSAGSLAGLTAILGKTLREEPDAGDALAGADGCDGEPAGWERVRDIAARWS